MDTFLDIRYLTFLLPFIGGFLYLLLLAVSGADMDGDGDVDLDVDHDHELQPVDYVGDDLVTEQSVNGTPFEEALAFFGIGKVPLAFVLITFLILWGVSGWTSLQIMDPVMGLDWVAFVLALIIAIAVSFVGTSRLARLLARLMPKSETYAVDRHDLSGAAGEVRFSISENFGSVQVLDRYGTLHEVEARVGSGEPTIPSGTKVHLFRYDREGRYYTVVTPAELSDMIDNR